MQKYKKNVETQNNVYLKNSTSLTTGGECTADCASHTSHLQVEDPIVHFDEQSLPLRKCSGEAFLARGLKVLETEVQSRLPFFRGTKTVDPSWRQIIVCAQFGISSV